MLIKKSKLKIEIEIEIEKYAVDDCGV